MVFHQDSLYSGAPRALLGVIVWHILCGPTTGIFVFHTFSPKNHVFRFGVTFVTRPVFHHNGVIFWPPGTLPEAAGELLDALADTPPRLPALEIRGCLFFQYFTVKFCFLTVLRIFLRVFASVQFSITIGVTN